MHVLPEYHISMLFNILPKEIYHIDRTLYDLEMSLFYLKGMYEAEIVIFPEVIISH